MEKQRIGLILFVSVTFVLGSFYAVAQSGNLEFKTDKDIYSIGDIVKISGTSTANKVSLSISSPNTAESMISLDVNQGKFEYSYKILPGYYGKILIKIKAQNELFSAVEDREIFVQNGSAGFVENGEPFSVFLKLWWTIPILMIVIGLTIYLEKELKYSYLGDLSKSRKLNTELSELKDEKSDIKAARSSLEDSYYKRKLDQKTFEKMIEDYERKVLEIDVKMGRIKDELKELQ